VLLTDVVMPVMNGREVANRVQALVPGVKTLFMSGYTNDSILRHGGDKGMLALRRNPSGYTGSIRMGVHVS